MAGVSIDTSRVMSTREEASRRALALAEAADTNKQEYVTIRTDDLIYAARVAVGYYDRALADQ